MTDTDTTDLVALTADLTSAHLSNNTVSADQVPELIRGIHAALAGLGQAAAEPEAAAPTGAISARKSLADPSRIISMIDGKPYSTLKRHLGRHGYTPESYRAAFGLPASYPMVAPAYSERRSSLARELGLGRKGKVAEVASAAAGGIKAALASAKEHLTGTSEKPPRKQLKVRHGDDND